jgi:hypothetical protein
MRVSASPTEHFLELTVRYSSPYGCFDEVPHPQSALFLRSAICQSGESFPLVEVSARGFKKSYLTFIWIPRTVEVLGGDCFEDTGSSFIAFESAVDFPHCLPQIPGVVNDDDAEIGRLPPLRLFRESFSHNKSLRSFCLPSRVEFVSESSFHDCARLSILTFELTSRLTRIEALALARCTSLELIVIPRSVRILCRNSFWDASALRTVHFETNSSLVRIESQAFGRCSSLRSFCIPSLVNRIEGDAFCKTALAEIVISEGNDHFRVYEDFLLSFDARVLILYFGDDSVVQIPDNIEVIGKLAFAFNDRLGKVEFSIDSQLRRIEARVFSGCNSLFYIYLPSFVDTIALDAFKSSAIRQVQVAEPNRHFRVSGDFLLNFQSTVLIYYFGQDSVVQIPSEVEVLRDRAFSCKTKVSTVAFASDSRLRRIETRAFWSCWSLESLFIPSLVTSIDAGALPGYYLSSIQIAETNTHFRVSGDSFLMNHKNSLVCHFGSPINVKVLREIESLSSRCFYYSRIRDLASETGSLLRRIESFAFFGCTGLRAFCIPSSVDWIDGSAFAYSGICEISIAEGNRSFRIVGDFLMDWDGTSVIRYFGAETEVTISCEVTDLSAGSFSFCQTIRRLVFEAPSKVRCIGVRAFEKCQGLESISIPPSIESVCESSFRKCKRLEEVRVEVGSKLARIEAESFSGCWSLTRIFIPLSVSGNEAHDLRGVAGLHVTWYE